MNRVGEVVKELEGFVVVKMAPTSACSGCHGCGNEDDNDDDVEVRASNTMDAHIGDIVEINMDAQDILQAAFIAYGIPFFALISGILIGDKIFNNEFLTIVLGFAFLTISYLVISKNETKFYHSTKYVPEVVKVFPKNRDICFKL